MSHVTGRDLGILMRALRGRGAPRKAAGAKPAPAFNIQTDAALTIAIIDGALAMLATPCLSTHARYRMRVAFIVPEIT